MSGLESSPSLPLLPRVEIDPAGEHRASIIWLHGLGADGHDFEPIVPELGLDPALGIRFVFPHAPRIPVTLNMGMVMPAWYDLDIQPGQVRHDAEGIERSAGHVRDLIEHERSRGIPPERILLAGFSQGGAVSLHVGLRYPERLAGILALSCYLLHPERLEKEASAANDGLAIFQAHGTQDPMVPFQAGEATKDHLLDLGYAVEWRSYPMAHQVCLEEIRDVAAFLRARFES